MIIVKEGREDMDHREASVTCDMCGCEFIAQSWEYHRIWVGHNIELRAKCPWCSNVVTRGETSAEEA